MKTIQTVAEMRSFVAAARQNGKSIAFVPTMGALHRGHQTLMQKAGEKCDLVIASVFVNPMQFGVNEDLAAYPRNLGADEAKAEAAGVAALFCPSVEEMYPAGFSSHVDVSGITEKLCGKSRVGHFRGVATVVTKLLNIVQPDRAFFGQKDAQQVLVLKRMAADLNLPVCIESLPIVREEDGLALSSRNAYLSGQEREAALVLSRSLKLAEEVFAAGERSAEKIRSLVEHKIAAEESAEIDYVEIYSYPELDTIDAEISEALLAVAVRFGTTRLIDNTILGGC